MLSGWKTGTPAARAISFMPRPVWRVEPRTWPRSRSGCVTRPTTSCGLASKASNVGSAKRPVPIITMRMSFVPRPRTKDYAASAASIFSISAFDGISPRSSARA